METETILVEPKTGAQTIPQLAPLLVQRLLEFKLRNWYESTIICNGETVTEFTGSFRSIALRWRVRTNSSWYVEQMRMLLDSNAQFEYEGYR